MVSRQAHRALCFFVEWHLPRAREVVLVVDSKLLSRARRQYVIVHWFLTAELNYNFSPDWKGGPCVAAGIQLQFNYAPSCWLVGVGEACGCI